MRLPGDPVFDEAVLEREYQVDFARQWRGYYRAGAALLPTLFLAFGLVDSAIVDAEHLPLVLTVRVVTSSILAAFVPVYFLESLRPAYERHLQSLLAVEAAVALGGLTLIGALFIDSGGTAWVEASTVGLLVAMAFLYGASRLRYPVVVGLGWLQSALALALLYRSGDGDPVFVATAVFHGVVTHALGAFVAATLEADAREAFLRTRELTAARGGTERLLHMVLHPTIGHRMRHTAGRTFAEVHPSVTVVLADLAGFTPLCQRLTPDEIGALLDRVFGRFDELCERHGALKIKTLGDAWLAVAGLPDPRPDHASTAADLARDMVDAVRAIREETGWKVGLRIGVASGPVVAGVIGRTRFAYDVWGATVQGAAAMESGSAVDRVRVDEATAAALGAGRVDEDGPIRWLRLS